VADGPAVGAVAGAPPAGSGLGGPISHDFMVTNSAEPVIGLAAPQFRIAPMYQLPGEIRRPPGPVRLSWRIMWEITAEEDRQQWTYQPMSAVGPLRFGMTFEQAI